MLVAKDTLPFHQILLIIHHKLAGGRAVKLHLSEEGEQYISNPHLSEATPEKVFIGIVGETGTNCDARVLNKSEINFRKLLANSFKKVLIIGYAIYLPSDNSTVQINNSGMPIAIGNFFAKVEYFVLTYLRNDHLNPTVDNTELDAQHIPIHNVEDGSVLSCPEPCADGVDPNAAVIEEWFVTNGGVNSVESAVGDALVASYDGVANTSHSAVMPVTILNFFTVVPFESIGALASVIVPSHMAGSAVLTGIYSATIIRHFPLLHFPKQLNRS